MIGRLGVVLLVAGVVLLAPVLLTVLRVAVRLLDFSSGLLLDNVGFIG